MILVVPDGVLGGWLPGCWLLQVIPHKPWAMGCHFLCLVESPLPAPSPLLLALPCRRCRYADEYSPVGLEALARSKVSIDRLQESDLDYANSTASLAQLRGRLKLAIANFQGCCGEYVNFVKKVRGAARGAMW
jgi:hypothetical protein